MHHSSEIRYLDKNYAGFLIIWDGCLELLKAEDINAFPVYGITKIFYTNNLLRITFHEVLNIINDVKELPIEKANSIISFNRPAGARWRRPAQNLTEKFITNSNNKKPNFLSGFYVFCIINSALPFAFWV